MEKDKEKTDDYANHYGSIKLRVADKKTENCRGKAYGRFQKSNG